MTFDYDIADRLLKLTPSATQVATDGSTNDVSQAERTTVDYTYAANGQLSTVVQSGGRSRAVKYAYDTLGRLRVKDTPEGTLTYDYDGEDEIKLISARYSYSGWNTNGATSFSGLSVSDTNSSHPEWNYIYDALGRLSQVNSNSTGADATYTYTDVGNLQTTSYRNGVTTTYTYNARNWLQMLQSTLGGTNIATFDYDGASGQGTWSNDRKLSPTGQRRQMYENVNGTVRTVAYDYDRLYRLVRENIAAPSTNTPTGLIFYGTDRDNMGYDAVGNRQSRQVSSTSTLSLGIDTFNGQSFDEKDRFSGGVNEYEYDANGSTTKDPINTKYVYDAENRLILRTNSDLSTIVITYDADGNRVGKTVITNGVTNVVTYLVEDRNPTGYAQVMEERDDTGADVIAYEYGLALISEKTIDGVFYYGFDGLGTTRYLTSCGCVGGVSAAVTDTYTYDAFGIQIAGTGSTQNHYRYTGQQWDEDLGMYYLRARYYAPQLGRFWTMDSFEGSISAPASIHKFIYCDLDPVQRTDLSGCLSLSATDIGTAVHKYIGEDFTTKVGGGFTGPSVAGVLREAGIPLTPGTESVVTGLFPDLTDTLNRQVYEIKPDNFRSIALGEAQLEAYIDVFNVLDPRKGWHRGTTYIPPFTVPLNPLAYAVALPAGPGLIVYKVIDIQKLVKRKTAETAASEENDMNDSMSITTFTSMLGV